MINRSSEEIESQAAQNNAKFFESASASGKSAMEQVSAAINELNADIFDLDSEARIRKAGWTPQQAEDIAILALDVEVGQIFSYRGQSLVRTPFKTVVRTQEYLNVLQDRILERNSVENENLIHKLREYAIFFKSEHDAFKSLTFIQLIKISFQRLFKGAK